MHARVCALIVSAALLIVSAWGESNFYRYDRSNVLALYTFQDGQIDPNGRPSIIRDVSGRNLLGDLMVSTTGAVQWDEKRQGMFIPRGSVGVRAVSSKTNFDLLRCAANGRGYRIDIVVENHDPGYEGQYDPQRERGGIVAGFGNWPPGSWFEGPKPDPNWVLDGLLWYDQGVCQTSYADGGWIYYTAGSWDMGFYHMSREFTNGGSVSYRDCETCNCAATPFDCPFVNDDIPPGPFCYLFDYVDAYSKYGRGISTPVFPESAFSSFSQPSTKDTALPVYRDLDGNIIYSFNELRTRGTTRQGSYGENIGNFWKYYVPKPLTVGVHHFAKNMYSFYGIVRMIAIYEDFNPPGGLFVDSYNRSFHLPNSFPYGVLDSANVTEEVASPIFSSYPCNDYDEDVTWFAIRRTPSICILIINNDSSDLALATNFTRESYMNLTAYCENPRVLQDSLVYQCADREGFGRNKTLILNIANTPDNPFAYNGTKEVFAKDEVSLTFTGYDSDPGETFTHARLVTLPARGTLRYPNGTAIGIGQKVPATVLFGADAAVESGVDLVDTVSFTFFVIDGTGLESVDSAIFTIKIMNNLCPTAQPLLSIPEDEDLLITLSGLDTVDETIVYEITSYPATGTLLRSPALTPITGVFPQALSDSNALVFRPTANAYGTETFTFQMRDPSGHRSVEASVTVTVVPVNDQPTLRQADGKDNVTGISDVRTNIEPTILCSIILEDVDPEYPTGQLYKLSMEAPETFLVSTGITVTNQDLLIDPQTTRVEGGGVRSHRVVLIAPFATIAAVLADFSIYAPGEIIGDVEISVEDFYLPVAGSNLPRRNSQQSKTATFNMHLLVTEGDNGADEPSKTQSIAILTAILGGAAALALVCIGLCVKAKMSSKLASKLKSELDALKATLATAPAT